MKKFLVISEVSKKQNYIFKTNKLKENIGASNIIEYITEDLPKKNLLKVLEMGDYDEIDELAEEKLKPYKVSVGGGNSLFILNEKEDAKNFIKLTTTEVLREYPGVEFFMTYHEFDFETESIIDAIDEIYKKLNDKKSARTSVFTRKSYGIEQECVRTGLPAYKNEGEYISKESSLKRKYADISLKEKSEKNKDYINDKTSINGLLKSYKEQGYYFSDELEDMITEKGDNSYIAIVTLDGNKMGQKIAHLKEVAKSKENINNMEESNKDYIHKLMEFSGKIKKIYAKAFDNMLERVSSSYDYVSKQLKLEKRNEKLVEEKNGEYSKIMPVRPIILAGDDVCFVCNAKIALECVEVFIKSLNEYKVEGEQLNACAGVCMLKSKYPFDKGYEIAEHLCANAKAKIVDTNDASLVDFHICQGEISTSINEIRSRAVIDKNIELNVKPLFINITEMTDEEKESVKNKNNNKIQRIIDKDKTYNTYENFKTEFEKIEKMASSSKGKVRKLRDVFPQGEKETRIFMNKNIISDKFNDGFNLPKDSVKYGFTKISDGKTEKTTCLYFDIIELLDMFIQLND